MMSCKVSLQPYPCPAHWGEFANAAKALAFQAVTFSAGRLGSWHGNSINSETFSQAGCDMESKSDYPGKGDRQ